MSNLTTQGTSTYQTGAQDTYTAVADNVDTVVDDHINGVCEAVVQIQTILGLGTDLKGSVADLVARLAVRHNADGTHVTQPVDEGGTNLTAYTAGDILYASDTTVLSKLGIGTFGQALITNSAGTAPTWGPAQIGALFSGPSSIGTGSTVSATGTSVTTAGSGAGDFSDGGYTWYTDQLTISAGDTLTAAGAARSFIFIHCRNSFTLNGTIDASGGGAAGGTSSTGAAGKVGGTGTDQAGGGGGDEAAPSAGAGAGGPAANYWETFASGAAAGDQSSATQVTGNASLTQLLTGPWYGGAGGGSGASTSAASGAGGAGGATVIIVAPTVTFGASAVINTSGDPGSDPGNAEGAGGGGGAGNILIICNTLTDGGVTYTQTGGAGGVNSGAGEDGGAGADGVKQILIFN